MKVSLFSSIFSLYSLYFSSRLNSRNTSTLESGAYNYISRFTILQPRDFTWKVHFTVASSQVDCQDIYLFNIA